MTRGLFLIQNLRGGGAERVVSVLLGELTREAAGSSYQLALLEPGIAYPVPDDVELHVLAFEPRSRVTAALALVVAFARLARLVARQRPDVVVSFLTRANLLNVAGRLLLPFWPRAVVSERAPIAETRALARTGWLEAALRRLYRRVDRVVAVSEGVAEEVRALGVPAERVVAIPNPVEASALAHRAREGEPHRWVAAGLPLVVTVGRLSPEKGHRFLLAALARVQRVRPARLVVFGEGPERVALEAETRALGLEGAVDWAGFQANPFATVARGDLFVLPSLFEGFPNALLEAMALGAPVVACDCPHGTRELLGGGRYGRLVPVADPAALAEAILELLGSEPLRRDLSARARRRAEAYGLPRVAESYRLVLEGAA